MLKSLNPLTKLFICLVWIAASLAIFDAWFQIGSILLACLLLIVLDRVRPLVVLALLVPFSLFGFGFLTTTLLFHRESDYALRVIGESPLVSPAFSTGITLFFRAVASGMISALFALTTDPGALVRTLMARCRLPAPVGYSLFASLALVPDLAAEAQQIRLARAMKRGRPPRRIPDPAELLSLIIPLLAFAIRRAGRAAIAMEARGLQSGAPRTIIDVPRFRSRDTVFALAALFALGLYLRLGFGI
jgi:energy-coupling factor transport system permease protein